MSLSEESNLRTLYVGNIDNAVSVELLRVFFFQFGQVERCKIIGEYGNNPYAFVKFTNHHCAAEALVAMNKRVILGKEMKITWWATSPGKQPEPDSDSDESEY